MNNDKYAYLIMAHDNFEVLTCLLHELDDARNAIFLHIDKKVDFEFTISLKHASLTILGQRLDVRWGSISQIECEYLLFEEAVFQGGSYKRYNLISGTHFPMKSQDEIIDYLERAGDDQLLRFLYTTDYEINFKLNYYHFFLNYYRYGAAWQRFFSQKMWQLILKFQKIFNIKRSVQGLTIKANNWVSITHDAVLYILSEKQTILKRFERTFCGDEYFIPYLLEGNTAFHMKDDQLLIYDDFEGGSNPKVLDRHDVAFLLNSKHLFARKFSDKELSLLLEIKQKI